MKQIFEKVLKDNLSGSGEILLSIQKALLQYGDKENFPDFPALLMQIDKLERCFPHFALLSHFLNELKLTISKTHSLKGNQLAAFVGQYQDRWKDTQLKASENLLKTLSLSGRHILLHSNSSAVHNLFRVMTDRKIPCTVWQTVSSPANEGLKQAKFLRDLGFDVHIFHEDAISKFIMDIDLAIFGADLLWDGAFLNKVGTLPISLVFGYFNKPVYVLAENRKKINTLETGEEKLRQFIDEQPKPTKEILRKPVPGLFVHNYYFETVPMSLARRVFTEK